MAANCTDLESVPVSIYDVLWNSSSIRKKERLQWSSLSFFLSLSSYYACFCKQKPTRTYKEISKNSSLPAVPHTSTLLALIGVWLGNTHIHSYSFACVYLLKACLAGHFFVFRSILLLFFIFLSYHDLTTRFRSFSSSKPNMGSTDSAVDGRISQRKSAFTWKGEKKYCNNIQHQGDNPFSGLFNRRSLEWHTKQHHLLSNSGCLRWTVIHRSTAHGN